MCPASAGGIFLTTREVQCPPPHLLRRSAWVCGLGAIPRRLLCCVLVAILSRPLLEGTGSLPAFYSLKTPTGDTSQFPCPHACLLPLPLALTVLSQPETKPRGASGVFFSFETSGAVIEFRRRPRLDPLSHPPTTRQEDAAGGRAGVGSSP